MGPNPFGWDLPPGVTDADIDRASPGYRDDEPDDEEDGDIDEDEPSLTP
jgi:hypothetical protein